MSNLPSTNEADIESIYLSSGTTGRPKGIKYTHGNKYSLISSICKDFKFTKSSRHLTFLPFGHTAALNYSVFPSLFVGSYMLIAKKFDNIRTSFFGIISNYSITYVQTVPTVISALLLIRENTLNLDLKSIPFVGCGSAPLSKSLQDKFYTTFRKKLANLYGLSETGPTHYDDPTTDTWQPGSIGITLSVNQCKLAVDGEILIKGENVFMGYYKDDKATQESFDGGWFKTGDFGEFNNGKLYFTDRKKDMLIIGGMNVYPAEIENVIKEITGIEECLVFGVEDKILGNKIIAMINSSNLNFKTRNDLKSEVILHCRRRLSNFKIPHEIRFVDHIPQTASGKLSRKEAKIMYLGT
jgi:acyl-CoA synthetase (AMP-forming)/AMP-acid ligase II